MLKISSTQVITLKKTYQGFQLEKIRRSWEWWKMKLVERSLKSLSD